MSRWLALCIVLLPCLSSADGTLRIVNEMEVAVSVRIGAAQWAIVPSKATVEHAGMPPGKQKLAAYQLGENGKLVEKQDMLLRNHQSALWIIDGKVPVLAKKAFPSRIDQGCVTRIVKVFDFPLTANQLDMLVSRACRTVPYGHTACDLKLLERDSACVAHLEKYAPTTNDTERRSRDRVCKKAWVSCPLGGPGLVGKSAVKAGCPLQKFRAYESVQKEFRSLKIPAPSEPRSRRWVTACRGRTGVISRTCRVVKQSVDFSCLGAHMKRIRKTPVKELRWFELGRMCLRKTYHCPPEQ